MSGPRRGELAALLGLLACSGSSASLGDADAPKSPVRLDAAVAVDRPPPADVRAPVPVDVAPDEAAPVADAAGDWWDSGWTRRRAIDLAAVATENLEDVPVLVLLDPMHVDYAATAANGADLRFVDERGAPLAHEIDTWSPGGASAIWVRLPRLPAGEGARFWLYYGNAAAPASASASDTWGPAYAAVWHFAGDARDATGRHDDGLKPTVKFQAGRVGTGATFDAAASDCISLGRGSHMVSGARGVTVSMWVRHQGEVQDEQDIILGIGTAETTGHLSRVSIAVSSELGFIGEANPDEGAWEVNNSAANTVGNGSWHYMTAVVDVPARTIALYADGKPLGVAFHGNWTATAYRDTPTDRVSIGCEEDRSKSFFSGSVDELRVETVARSAAAVAAQARLATGAAVTVGDEQRRP